MSGDSKRRHAAVALEGGLWRLKSAIRPVADDLNRFLVEDDGLRDLPPDEKAVIRFDTDATVLGTSLGTALRSGLSPDIMSDLVHQGTIKLVS